MFSARVTQISNLLFNQKFPKASCFVEASNWRNYGTFSWFIKNEIWRKHYQIDLKKIFIKCKTTSCVSNLLRLYKNLLQRFYQKSLNYHCRNLKYFPEFAEATFVYELVSTYSLILFFLLSLIIIATSTKFEMHHIFCVPLCNFGRAWLLARSRSQHILLLSLK